jgi:glycosyltransferase involved in cell wall biosynthesis
MQKNNPSISVIVPAYNSERYIGRCLESLLSQTFADIEIICIDNFSSDKTADVAESYAKTDKRIKLFRQTEKSDLSSARNAGLKNARAPYIMFCDSDDIYMPDMCAKMYRAVSQNGIDFAVCRIEILWETAKKSNDAEDGFFAADYQGAQTLNGEIIRAANSSLCNKIFKKEKIDKYGIIFQPVFVNEDGIFCNSYASVSKTAFFIKENLYVYIRRGGSVIDTAADNIEKFAAAYFNGILYFREFLVKNNIYDSYESFFWEEFLRYTGWVLIQNSSSFLDALFREQASQIIQTVNPDLSKLDKNIAADIYALKMKKFKPRSFETVQDSQERKTENDSSVQTCSQLTTPEAGESKNPSRAFNPFILNKFICVKNEDTASYETFFKTVGGNIGNSYIAYSVMKLFSCGVKQYEIRDFEGLHGMHFTKDDLNYINSGKFSHVFLCLTDIIREHTSYNYSAPWSAIAADIEKVKIPFVVFGLGSNSFCGFDPDLHKKISPDLIRFLKTIASKTVSLGVRGAYTAEILTKLGIVNFDIVGCPTFYESGQNRVIEKQGLSANDKIIFSSPNIKYSGLNFSSVLQDMEEFPQGIVKNWAVLKDCRLKSKFDGHPILRTEIIKMLLDGKAMVFSDIERWKSEVKKHKFSLGSRVHGSILSLNCGVPSVVTNRDARAKEMCELFNMPLFPGFGMDKEISFENLKELYDSLDYGKMNKNYPLLYDNFQKWLKKNGIAKEDVNAQILHGGGVKQPVIEIDGAELSKSCLTVLRDSISYCRELKSALNGLQKQKRFYKKSYKIIPKSLGLFISRFIFKKKNRIRFLKKYVRR